MTDRELMQQAFDAMSYGNADEREAARLALRERLAQTEQEPVAWIQPNHLQKARQAPFLCRVEPNKRMADFVGIYTAPPQRKPPPECKTEEEKTAFAFGWLKAMEAQRLGQPDPMPLFDDWPGGWGKCPPCNQRCEQGRACPARGKP